MNIYFAFIFIDSARLTPIITPVLRQDLPPASLEITVYAVSKCIGQ